MSSFYLLDAALIHIEAGYFNGAGKDLYILQLEDMESELMYLMATALCLSVDELMACLAQ